MRKMCTCRVQFLDSQSLRSISLFYRSMTIAVDHVDQIDILPMEKIDLLA